MDQDPLRYVETLLGFKPGRLRSGKGGKMIGTPKLTEGERARLRAFYIGICTRDPLGVFVYNHWLDVRTKRLYESPTARVRLTRNEGWVASVLKGVTASGSTPQEAAARLTTIILNAVELAEVYQTLNPKAGALPTLR